MVKSLLVITISLAALCLIGPLTASPPIKRDNNNNNNNNFCQGCRALVSFSQTFNSSSNRTEYKEIFKNFCELYYPVSTDFQQGPCPLFVEGLYTLLDHIDPLHHCDQIGACGPTQGVTYKLDPALTLMTPKQADVICKFCEQSVEQVQSALSDPAIIDQVRRQADQLCDYFKVVDADKECRQLINKYLDQAVEFVRQIDPKAYCRSIQLCPAQQQQRPLAKKSGASHSRPLNALASSSSSPALPTLADFNDFGIETSVIIGGQPTDRVPSSSSSSRSNAPACLLCKTFVKEMFHFLRENKTEANIVKGLNQVCQMFFRQGEELEQCQSMVRAYTKELIQLLVQETDPEMVCVLLEQCVSSFADGFRQPPQVASASQRNDIGAESSLSFLKEKNETKKNKTIDLGDLIHKLDPTVKLKSAKVCFECKMFIKYLRNVMDEPKSRDYIKQWLLSNLCNSIPERQTRDECTQLVTNYADTFFSAVMGTINPSTACFDLGACTQRTLVKVLHIDTLAPFDKPDETPSFVVSPKAAAAAAAATIERQPQPVAISASSSSTSARRHQQPTQQALAGLKGQLCDQCVQIVTQIDEYLANHPIDKDVSVLIDQVCNKLQEGSVRDECVYMIEAFGSQIAQAVSTMDNPRQLCGQIMLCQSS